MGREPKKKKNRKSLIFRLCMFAFVAYAAVMLVDMQISIGERRRELEEIRRVCEIQRIENKELERQLAAGLDDEYIERLARDKLGFVYPEERVFIDISGS